MNSSPQNSEIQVASRRAGGAVENSEDEDWSGLVECAVLERSKSERGTRADEDRRRRTIIVEKKNGTYGFTLQSYGIHYKREQEIEMVTYVDYVEYDGPAFKAGMREGDVILSINGHEMDRADHKTLVNFIKNCDARMRMVVSFEDCVRKVELHMRYIELQRALQSRLAELERLCERERSILMGKWKTHSLPARKRTPTGVVTTNPGQPSPSSSFNSSTVQCCRPATSTEHLLLYSVYADGRPCLIPRNAACLVAVGPPRSRSDHHHFSTKSSNVNDTSSLSSRHSYHQANGISGSSRTKSQHKSGQSQSQSCSAGNTDSHQQTIQQHNSLCVACISSAHRRRADQTESGSLDFYDLASPCCDPNCVPSRRRREKQRRARNEQQQHQQQQQQQNQHQQQQNHQQQQQNHQQQQQQNHQQQQQNHQQQNHQQQNHHQHHHMQQREQHQQSSHSSHNCSRASGHSLHSITSSEISTAGESVASCSTSLSTDTLYWDPNIHHQRPPACLQYAKPKSWDNLTTKAFGGYGFGYGYLDTGSVKTQSAERPGKSSSHSSRGRTTTSSSSSQRRSAGVATTIYATTATNSSSATSTTRHSQAAKSTENLLLRAPYNSQERATAESSPSCECLDPTGSRFVQQQHEKHAKRQEDSADHSSSGNNGHQQQTNNSVRHRRSSHSDGKLRSSNNSEITRL